MRAQTKGCVVLRASGAAAGLALYAACVQTLLEAVMGVTSLGQKWSQCLKWSQHISHSLLLGC